jgi:hypothetical protein
LGVGAGDDVGAIGRDEPVDQVVYVHVRETDDSNPVRLPISIAHEQTSKGEDVLRETESFVVVPILAAAIVPALK